MAPLGSAGYFFRVSVLSQSTTPKLRVVTGAGGCFGMEQGQLWLGAGEAGTWRSVCFWLYPWDIQQQLAIVSTDATDLLSDLEPVANCACATPLATWNSCIGMHEGTSGVCP